MDARGNKKGIDARNNFTYIQTYGKIEMVIYSNFGGAGNGKSRSI